jgi:hypothetical protein
MIHVSVFLMVLGLQSVSAHMQMIVPKTCEQVSKYSKFKHWFLSRLPKEEVVGTYQAGSTIDVNLAGSAYHGGGGCAFSLSYDEEKHLQSSILRILIVLYWILKKVSTIKLLFLKKPQTVKAVSLLGHGYQYSAVRQNINGLCRH